MGYIWGSKTRRSWRWSWYDDDALSYEEFLVRQREFLDAYIQEDNSIKVLEFIETSHNIGHAEEGMEVMMDVYYLVYQWQYSPNIFIIEAGTKYEFNFMSVDVTHGASINTNSISLMIRLPPKVLVTYTLQFDDPGTYLIYCSFYCALGHEYMFGTIQVI